MFLCGWAGASRDPSAHTIGNTAMRPKPRLGWQPDRFGLRRSMNTSKVVSLQRGGLVVCNERLLDSLVKKFSHYQGQNDT